MKEGFVIADDADEKAIGDYLASVQKNLVTAGAGRERFGIPDVHTRNTGQRARKGVGRNTSGQRIIKFQNHGNRI